MSEKTGLPEFGSRYICNICGYVYDPMQGDPDHNISWGTPFEKLPDNWTCPQCGATKDLFEAEEQKGA